MQRAGENIAANVPQSAEEERARGDLDERSGVEAA